VATVTRENIDKVTIFNYNFFITAITETFVPDRNLILLSVSVLTIVGITMIVVANGLPEGVSSNTDASPGTGNPDPCEEALRRIEDHRQNYERIVRDGPSPEDIKLHGSREGALAHYKGNGEQMQRSYDKHCT
jgi:hypothetical protein